MIPFEKCYHAGGKIRTVSLSKNRYRRVCINKKGKVYKGEIKKRK